MTPGSQSRPSTGMVWSILNYVGACVHVCGENGIEHQYHSGIQLCMCKLYTRRERSPSSFRVASICYGILYGDIQ